MRKLRRSVERHQRSRKLASAATMAMLATSLFVAGSVEHVYAAPRANAYGIVVQASEIDNIQTIDISQATINNGRIYINIDSSGAYKLTGSNLRNGAYVDVQIVVGSKATVDLYLDNLNIVNDDCVDTSLFSSSFFSSDSVSPIVVYGTANVRVLSNSSISAIEKYFTVDGRLNFVDSVEDATLTCGLQTYLPGLMEARCADGRGTIAFQGAKVVLDSTNGTGQGYFSFDIGCNVIPGDNVTFGEKVHLLKVTVALGSSVYDIPLDGWTNIKTPEGFVVDGVDVDELIPNARLVKLDNTLLPDLACYTDASGALTDVYLPGTAIYYLKNDTDFKRYAIIDGWLIDETKNAYSIKKIDASDSSVIFSDYDVEGATIELPEEDENYTFTYELADGTPVSGSITLTHDTVVKVFKEEKTYVDITVNGESATLLAGSSLSSQGYNTLCADLRNMTFLSPSTPVVGGMNIKTLSIDYELRDGEKWFELDSADGVNDFADLVSNYGFEDLNGFLSADVELDNSFAMIGRLDNSYYSGVSLDNSYRGSFDGQGHTVTLNLSKDAERVAFFGCVGGGAVIKNVNIAGSVEGTKRVAGLVATALDRLGFEIVIQNCTNSATVSSTTGYAGGIVGKRERGYIYEDIDTTKLTIDSCANTGAIAGDISSGGIIGSIDCYNIVISNCYNSCSEYLAGASYRDEAATNCVNKITGEGEDVTELADSAFSSGEVAYRINEGAGRTIWYQTCGEGYPSVTGNAATQTVYAGYANCTAQELSYANSEFEHTEQGHKLAGSSGTISGMWLNDGVIYVSCEYCDEEFAARLVVNDDEMGQPLRRVTVEYNDAWVAAGFPNVMIEYYANGSLTNMPDEPGTWEIIPSLDDNGGVNTGLYYTIRPQRFRAVVENGQFENASPDSASVGSYTEGTVVSVSAAEPEAHKHFARWSVISGEGVTFADAESAETTFTMPAGEVAIAAVYETDSHTVTFAANGGTGTMPAVTVVYGQQYELLECGFTAPEGKRFDGWGVGDSMLLILQQAGEKFTVTGDVTVRSFWETIPVVTPTPSPEPTPAPEVTPTPSPEVTPAPAPYNPHLPGPAEEPTPAPEVTPVPTPEVTPGPVVTPVPTPEAEPVVAPEPTPGKTEKDDKKDKGVMSDEKGEKPKEKERLSLFDEGIKKELLQNATFVSENMVGKTLATDAFKNNTEIKAIAIPEKTKNIGTRSFKNCINLIAVEFNDGLKRIGKSAFYGCISLTTVDLPASVTKIEGYAFKNCVSLTELELPQNVSSLGEAFISGCKNLKTLTIESDKLSEKNIADGAFRGAPKTLTVYVPEGKTDEYIELFRLKGASSKIIVTDITPEEERSLQSVDK